MKVPTHFSYFNSNSFYLTIATALLGIIFTLMSGDNTEGSMLLKFSSNGECFGASYASSPELMSSFFNKHNELVHEKKFKSISWKVGAIRYVLVDESQFSKLYRVMLRGDSSQIVTRTLESYVDYLHSDHLLVSNPNVEQGMNACGIEVIQGVYLKDLRSDNFLIVIMFVVLGVAIGIVHRIITRGMSTNN